MPVEFKTQSIPEAQRAYSTLLDARAYQDLISQRSFLAPDVFSQKLQALNALTKHNVETSIGERFNVELFCENYAIAEGQITHPSFEIPFLQVVKNGQKYRQQNGSNDLEREMAEVVGFEKVQELLTKPDIPSDEKVIVISPKGKTGSIYQHNFFDVYQKDQGGQITMSRHTSKLTWRQFKDAAQKADSLNLLPDNPTDADFLKHPLVTYKTKEQLLQIFSPQENTMPMYKYQELLEACAPLTLSYLNTLAQNPDALISDQNYLRILKFAHIFTGIGPQAHTPDTRNLIIRQVQEIQFAPWIASQLDAQQLPQVKTGCGISGSPSASITSAASLLRPFSVSEFGLTSQNAEKVEDFQCPGRKTDGSPCTYTVRAYSGVKKCPECGMSATCA